MYEAWEVRGKRENLGGGGGLQRGGGDPASDLEQLLWRGRRTGETTAVARLSCPHSVFEAAEMALESPGPRWDRPREGLGGRAVQGQIAWPQPSATSRDVVTQEEEVKGKRK